MLLLIILLFLFGVMQGNCLLSSNLMQTVACRNFKRDHKIKGQKEDLDPQFVDFLVEIHSSVEEFESLPITEKAAVFSSFRTSQSKAGAVIFQI